jgi:AcrR family transcriptional regulator/DNA-binding MarR family transcriptional regulator
MPPASRRKPPVVPAERDGFARVGASRDGGQEGARGHVTEIQRARMIAAMIDVVSERTRANATVAHVVARSGVSRRTFYEVFEDFEDCFLAALDQARERASEYVLSAYDPAARWRVRIRAALIGLLEFVEDEPAMGRLCIVETLGAGRRVHERRMRVIDLATAAVDEGRKEAKAAKTLPPLTAEGVVGGVLSVLHARLVSGDGGSLRNLTGPLMGMVALPYLGPTVAQKESVAPLPARRLHAHGGNKDPLRDLEMRLTYRTVRVLLAIANTPGKSNREVGVAAGIDDQGQISKLLSRLERLGLIANAGAGQVRGSPNAWTLTDRGVELEQLVAGQASAGAAH